MDDIGQVPEKLKCKLCCLDKLANISNFKPSKGNRYGFTTLCKPCIVIKQKIYRSANRVKINTKRQLHYFTIKEKIKKWDLISKENVKNKRKKDQAFDAEIKRKKNIKHMGRYRNDPAYKLRHRIRARVSCAIRKKYKKIRFAVYLGCDVVFLKKYLESMFKPGMSWKNHGSCGWHIDHIIPLSSAKNEKEAYLLCHYTNLQPLWAKDNLKKSNKT